MKSNKSKSIIEKCYMLLKSLSDMEWHTIRELAASVELDKSTVSRHIAWMESVGMAEIKTGRTGGIRLTRQIIINGAHFGSEQIHLLIKGVQRLPRNKETKDLLKSLLLLTKGGK